MSSTIYKLTRSEVNQAIADYITKKYGITGTKEALLDLNIQGSTELNALLVTATVKWKDPEED